MNHLVTLITIVIAFNVFVEAGKYSGFIKSVAKSCQGRENASDADVDQLADGKAPTTKEGKCLAACMGKQFGIIMDDKLSREGFLAKAKLVLTSESDLKKAEDVYEGCKDVTNEDRCEAAGAIWDCIEVGSKKQGIDLF